MRARDFWGERASHGGQASHGERTSWGELVSHGERTSWGELAYHGERTSWGELVSHGERTSWGELASCGERACPALGCAAAPGPGASVCQVKPGRLQWGRFAAQRGASPLATIELPSPQSPANQTITCQHPITCQAQPSPDNHNHHLPAPNHLPSTQSNVGAGWPAMLTTRSN